MHLASDAFNEAAVEKLRNVKKRDGKPFAVMFRDLETLKRYTIVDKQERTITFVVEAAIVLLEIKTGEENQWQKHQFGIEHRLE